MTTEKVFLNYISFLTSGFHRHEDDTAVVWRTKDIYMFVYFKNNEGFSASFEVKEDIRNYFPLMDDQEMNRLIRSFIYNNV